METNSNDLPPQPFHVEYSNYSNDDISKIKKFMEEDTHTSFSIPRGPRDGKFIVEIPPDLPRAEEFKHLMLSEIPDEMQSCHPLLRRRDIFVRFVSRLEEQQQGSKPIGADCDCLDAEENGKVKYYIRIALSKLRDVQGDNLIANLVGKIVHEIAETDYYLKSQDGSEDSKALFGKKDYNFSEDEEVANRRVIRVLKRKYPDAEWIGIDYPIDKQ